jgi:hypothetical protein
LGGSDPGPVASGKPPQAALARRLTQLAPTTAAANNSGSNSTGAVASPKYPAHCGSAAATMPKIAPGTAAGGGEKYIVGAQPAARGEKCWARCENGDGDGESQHAHILARQQGEGENAEDAGPYVIGQVSQNQAQARRLG